MKIILIIFLFSFEASARFCMIPTDIKGNNLQTILNDYGKHIPKTEVGSTNQGNTEYPLYRVSLTNCFNSMASVTAIYSVPGILKDISHQISFDSGKSCDVVIDDFHVKVVDCETEEEIVPDSVI